MPCDQSPRMAARVERERCGEEAGEGPGSSQAHEPLLASPNTDLEQEQCVSSLLAHYQQGSHWTACRVPGKQSCGKDCTSAGGSGLGRGGQRASTEHQWVLMSAETKALVHQCLPEGLRTGYWHVLVSRGTLYKQTPEES